MTDNSSIDKLSDAAKTLLRDLISSPSDYPNSKDKLFVDCQELWPLNACIHKFDGIDAYAIGYLNAAKLLARIVIYSQSRMDTLVYPIIYLYRHYLEIRLKDLIRQGANITGTPTDERLEEILNGSHHLMKLWNNFKPFFIKVSGGNGDFDNVKKGMESYINQIHAIDPASFTFRYDRAKHSTEHNLEKHERINLFHFCQNMEKLTRLIEGTNNEFSATLDCVNDMLEEYCDYQN